ncbi:hypothetical protein RhiirA5_427294 [Rhizophagus irregularis]|uniref:F-box domain-containing protein n=1 Tax=Rhizophagus irregularis TaxID=588596 RepID=A0A2N0P2J9_9GLOM|nr:hypothetical protein RhiirA5_427294 [Rhizophagus irregularis]
MSILYKDILYPIFEELHHDKKSLASCLRVNKIWCEIVIPILWRNPWERSTLWKKEILLNVIISHLSDEARNNFDQHFNFFKNSYKRPLFNYISFCRHLNLEVIENMMNIYIQYEEFRNDVLKLFINKNADYTHLYMPNNHDYHLIPGVEQCFSEIEFLKCNGKVNDNTLSILTKTCKSIKELKIYSYENDYNYQIAKLIENQKELFSISFLNNGRSSRKIIENSLIKHADTIQYFSTWEQPKTKVLTSFVNLKILKLINASPFVKLEWDNIKDLTLPSLHTLIACDIPINYLINLIESSGRNLIKIYYHHNHDAVTVIDDKKFIQAIYQNCPDLMYLEFLYKNKNNIDFEKLLINCQHLKRLDFCIYFYYNVDHKRYSWDNLFNILAKSSPPSLFEFAFKYTNDNPKLESLRLFFDNWEGRHPISLKFKKERYHHYDESGYDELIDLIERYKKKGVVKKFIYYYDDEDSDLLEIYKAKKNH